MWELKVNVLRILFSEPKMMGKNGITIVNPKDKTGIEKDGRIFSQAANECMILTFKGKVEGVRKAILNWKSEILQTKYSTLMRKADISSARRQKYTCTHCGENINGYYRKERREDPRHVLSLLIIHHSIDGIKRY